MGQADDFISKFLDQVAVISSAPRPHIVFLALMGGGLWFAMDWRYGGMMANRDSTIALITAQRDDYKDKLGGASPDQAKARIDSLEKRLALLEPRHLSDIDKSVLLKIPRSRKVSIVFQSGDSDTADLSNEISNFLISSGYSIEGPSGRMILTPQGSPRGVSIDTNDSDLTKPVQITVGIK
jgi:hypothetical protein